MSKYRHIAVYYPRKDVSLADWSIGRYINELLDKGIESVTILNRHEPHEYHKHDVVETPEEETYTDIQGNVGSS